ncbi:MAG: hypothetical protein QM698_16765 [Micropepsaceae bacterium]
MYRSCLAAALLAGAALAATIDPGSTPGLSLLNDGLPGSANEASKSPDVAITAGGMKIELEKTTLAEVAAKFGGEVNTTGEEASFAWLCYAAPAIGTGGASLTWFYAVDANAQLVSGIATEYAPDETPPGCTKLETPIGLTTGLPGLGAPVADLDTVFGKATADSGIPGTASYMFGSKPEGNGFVARTEAKYIMGDTHILATSVMSVVEEE